MPNETGKQSSKHPVNSVKPPSNLKKKGTSENSRNAVKCQNIEETLGLPPR